MPNKKDGASHILDLVAGVGKELGKKIVKRVDKLAQDLAKDQPLMPTTGVAEGSQYDELLSHLYRLTLNAQAIGDVIDVFDYKTEEGRSTQMARISIRRNIIEAVCPKGAKIKSGMSVRLNQHNQIIGIADGNHLGPIATVQEVTENFATVEIAGASRSVRLGLATDASRGDRVILDEMQLVIIGMLPKDSLRFTLTRPPKNSFDDIVGQDDAVMILKEVVDYDPKQDKVAGHYLRQRTKGVLLFGPPGCGKTMLGEAVAHRMAERHGKQALSSGYIYVKGPELLNMYVGESERGIRNCFEEADQHFKDHNYPAVLVFDECESLLSRRGVNKSADMEKTIVPTFLGLMNETTAFVMLMTNREDTLDPAVIRDGRFDRQIFIGRPTCESAEIILMKNLARYPLDQKDSDREVLARIAAEAFFDPAKHLFSDPYEFMERKIYFTLAEIVNGAMLTRIITDAVLLAERRDRKNATLSGVSRVDILDAIEVLFAEKKKLKHQDEVREFLNKMKDSVPDEAKIQAMKV